MQEASHANMVMAGRAIIAEITILDKRLTSNSLRPRFRGVPKGSAGPFIAQLTYQLLLEIQYELFFLFTSIILALSGKGWPEIRNGFISDSGGPVGLEPKTNRLWGSWRPRSVSLAPYLKFGMS